MIITINQLKNKIKSLHEAEINHSWQGHGSAIFLELGNLETTQSDRPRGEACIWVEWDWRVERNGKILFGSANSRSVIEKGISKLIGLTIENIEITGETPELSIYLSEGYKVQTMAMVSGDPRWTIRLKNEVYLSWKNGSTVETNGDEPSPGLTTEEKEDAEFIGKIAERIGKPSQNPIIGNCKRCKFFFYIEGRFDLFDYGVCVNALSTFDQRMVRVNSGCPSFVADE